MPLMHGKSKKAFEHNVRTEMEEHPGRRAQNLAIAYAMKRKSKKAHGGEVKPESKPKPEHMTEDEKIAENEAIDNESLEDKRNNYPGMPKKQPKPMMPKLAAGGFIEEENMSGFVKHPGNDVKDDHAVMAEDERKLGQHGVSEVGPQHGGQGFHGESYEGNPGDKTDNYQSAANLEKDLVDRIIEQRMYSLGGEVANGGEDKLSQMADSDPNEFDDLALEDDLEFHETGANSGDELGNARTDEDEHDVVAKVMRSRAKKDRLPNPR